jgi:futalosine hydrolase
LALGQSVLASHSAFADEGVLTDAGYRTIAQMGFVLGPPPVNDARVAGHARLLAALTPLVDTLAPIATVSTCSGTDALARIVRDRTGAAAECMEGAAIALVCARLGARFAELRTISNTTGDRSGQRWDSAGALARLSSILGRIDWPSLGG